MPLYDDWLLESADLSGPQFSFSSPLLASVVRRRGVDSDEAFRRFVAPELGDLHDPSTIHGIGYACDRIERAIRDHESILIYGDYDVDGVTSIVLLRTVLTRLGAQVDFVIPHRLVDGYGLKWEVLERVEQERNVRLVITVDCGITSVEPVRRAIDRGIDVIITDHHLPPGVLPEAAAVLNPKQPGCLYPFKELAGVGVTFKLCCELLRRSGSRMSVASLLKIAAIGTIADVAPLIGENRAIVRMGLAGLADCRNPGLRALIRSVGAHGRALRAADVGFKIGPRINAAGRLASADTAIHLFAARDEEEAGALVAELERLNRERQGIEASVRQEAEAQIATGTLPGVLVLAGAGWHRGVLGLTAGRIAQRYHRPALVISIDGEHCVGSARSIPTVNLHEALSEVASLFSHFGGHDFACGFSLPTVNLARLAAELGTAFSAKDPAIFRRSVPVEGEVTSRMLTRNFIEELDALEPFGAGNVRPVFLLRGVGVQRMREFSPGCHALSIRDGEGTTPAVLWPSQASLLALFASAAAVDLLVHVQPTEFEPQKLRLEIVDAAVAGERGK